MTSEEKAIFKEEIRNDIKDAVHSELGEYKVPKEEHYKHHLWLQDWIAWQDKIKSSVLKSILKSIIGIFITTIAILLLYGFIFFGKINFGGK